MINYIMLYIEFIYILYIFIKVFQAAELNKKMQRLQDQKLLIKQMEDQSIRSIK